MMVRMAVMVLLTTANIQVVVREIRQVLIRMLLLIMQHLKIIVGQVVYSLSMRMTSAIKVLLNQMVQKDGSTTDTGGAGAGSGGGSINIFYHTNTSSSTTMNVKGGVGGTRPSNSFYKRCPWR